MSTLLPEWMPNIHPLIIHFPIVILILTVAFQFLALIVKRPKWIEISYIALLVGIASLIVTYITGQIAVDSVMLPAKANSLMNNHADFALLTLIYFTSLGVVILLAWKMGKLKNKVMTITIVLLGAAGVGILARTADYGGQLVYRYGVGVSGADSNIGLSPAVPDDIDSTIIAMEDGSWIWNIDSDQSNRWVKNFEWLEGAYNNDMSVGPNMADEAYVVILANDSSMLFVTGKELEAVQVDIAVDLTDFKGVFKVVHHVSDRNNYDYFSMSAGKIELGRIKESKPVILSEDDKPVSGLVNIRVVGMKRHFRSYINGELVLHGHGDDLPPGKVGLYIQGTGAIRIKSMSVEVLEGDHDG